MNHIYFVSYMHETGPGRVQMTLPAAITTMEQIVQIEEWIRNDLAIKGRPAVINYQLLRTEKR